jgi:hypothetical protein
MQQRIKKLEELVEIQCSHGNWDFDPYMHGMANGMILALSIMKNEEPKYMSAPDTWLNSIPDPIAEVEPTNE